MTSLYSGPSGRQEGKSGWDTYALAADTLVFGLFAYVLWFFAFGNFEQLMARIPDDACYFFKIAENITGGFGSTFDQLHATNGYQPLWLIVLLPVAALRPDSPEAAFRLYLLIQLGLLLGAVLLLRPLLWRRRNSVGALVGAVVFALYVVYKAANGMESSLLILMLAILYRVASWAMSAPTAGRMFVTGLVLGLVMLARLDMVFTGVALCAAVAWSQRSDIRTAFTSIMAVAIGAAVLTIPYLLFNHVSFGSVMPISGALKTSYPAANFSIEKLRWLGPQYLAFVGVAIVYLPWYAANRNRSRVSGAIVVLGVTVLFHFVNILFYVKWGVFRWQFIPYALFAAFALSEMVDHLARPRGLRALVVVGAAGLMLGGVRAMYSQTFGVVVEQQWQVHTYRAALWAREKTAATTVFGMKDSGRFGYFSGRRVVNLDGLVNGMDYQTVLRSGRLNPYFRSLNLEYIVQHGILLDDENLRVELDGAGVGDGQYRSILLRYRGLRDDVHSDPIRLHREDEAFKARAPGAGDAHTLVVWRYRPPAGTDGALAKDREPMR